MIRIKDFTFVYPSRPVPALKSVDLEFCSGEVVLIAGPNGSGKSTLLKSILGVVPRFTRGKASGEIFYRERPVQDFQVTRLAGEIGIVLQDPESQISNLTVWDEVTFGPANLCLPVEEIVARSQNALTTMEIDRLGGISVLALSGGQLQRLSLACLLAMRPKVVILDEPMANLDPWGVASVIEALKILLTRVELIIISSHWLDPFIELANRIVIISEGHVALDFPARNIYQHLSRLEKLNVEIPQVCQLYRALSRQGLQVEPSLALPNLSPSLSITPLGAGLVQVDNELVSLSSIKYQYPSGEIALKDVNLTLYEFGNTILVGHNGAGKSTLSRLLVGLRKPSNGVIRSLVRKPALMVQKPTLGFLGNTVAEEISYGTNLTQQQIGELLENFSLIHLRDQSPFKISGGEQRKLALVAALASRPDLLVLDESTAGLDAYQVKAFLDALDATNVSVVHITHDPRVVAHSQRVVALEKGQVIYDGPVYNLDKQLIGRLGYQHISAATRFSLNYVNRGIPMLPEQIEVRNENRIL